MLNPRSELFPFMSVAVLAVTSLAGCGQTESGGQDSLAPLREELQEVRESMKELDETIQQLQHELADGDSANDSRRELVEEAPADDEFEIRSLSQAKQVLADLGEKASAEDLATFLADLDTWVVEPQVVESFQQFKVKLAERLRQVVRAEVLSLQEKALIAETARKGAELHVEAGRILSLYPMSEDEAVLEEAKKLSSRQGEVVARLEVIRRQRYNQWATEKIKAALDGYNANKSYWSPKKENPRLIKSLVENLGEVDPVLLEPVVIELYNYIVELTKGSISEEDKLDLARQLTNPKIERKTLGDF